MFVPPARPCLEGALIGSNVIISTHPASCVSVLGMKSNLAGIPSNDFPFASVSYVPGVG